MKHSISALCLVVLVAGCFGPQLPPEVKAKNAEATAARNAALKSAAKVNVAGNDFRVANLQDRGYALVKVIGGSAPYFAANLETAATQATGCKSVFDAGILAGLTGDIRSTDLRVLDAKISGRFDGWRVNLTC